MKPGISATKSCEPQQLVGGEPAHDWGVENLGRYCQAQHETIVSGEKELTPVYWRLGLALNLARKHFNYGQWAKYLASLGIEKTRASKARTIFRSFSTAEKTVGLSVEVAYAQRRRKHEGRGRATSCRKTCDASLDDVRRDLERLINDAQFVTPSEGRELLNTTQELICRLQEFERNLLQQIDESNRDPLWIDEV
jgi:hypothetical protein